MRFYVCIVGVRDCSQLTTILCVSLVSPTPPFPRSHHNALQVRVRIFVIGWCRRAGRLGRASIFVYCSSYAPPGKQRGLDVLPDPKFSPAHNQRRFVLFCVKGLTDIRSLNLLGPTWTSFVSDIESFFMTIRTKCPFVIEWIKNTTVIVESTMICKMSFDVRILYVHVNVTLTKFAIRLGPVSGGRSGNRCRLCIEKPLLMRKLEPRYDNPPLASSSLSILTKRFVLSIVKHCYMCVIGFLLRSCTTVLYPTSSLSSYCLRDRRKDL